MKTITMDQVEDYEPDSECEQCSGSGVSLNWGILSLCSCVVFTLKDASRMMSDDHVELTSEQQGGQLCRQMRRNEILKGQLEVLKSQIPTSGSFAWALQQCNGNFELIGREHWGRPLGEPNGPWIVMCEPDLLATDWVYYGPKTVQ